MDHRTLIFGRGWLGTTWAAYLEDAVLTAADIADEAAIREALDGVRPERVINAAGRTGRPGVDTLESEPAATYRSNVVGPILLASACRRRGIHFTHLGTGCVYRGDGGGRGFSEGDPPNFQGNLYARTKQLAERALLDLDALQLRIRLPFAATPHPRNLLTKLLAFERTFHAPNSVTILEDAWPAATVLVDRAETGIYNLVNDGVEFHDEVLATWRDRVAPGHRFEIVEEAMLAGRAPRTNCILSTAKLREAGLALPPFAASLPGLIDAYAKRTGPEGARRDQEPGETSSTKIS